MTTTQQCRLSRTSARAKLLILFTITSVICQTVQSRGLEKLSNASSQQSSRGDPSTGSDRSSRFVRAFNIHKYHAPPLQIDDILSRLEVAATLRDNLVRSLGRVLQLCLNENARVPFEVIHEAIRTRHVATYDLLPILPFLRGYKGHDQLYTTMQALEAMEGSFVPLYATLCMEALLDGNVHFESALGADLLKGISNDVIESIANDEHRKHDVPSTLNEAEDVILVGIADNTLPLKLGTVAILMLNTPNFDLTYPEVSDSIRFIAEYMNDRSILDDPLFKYIRPGQMDSVEKLIKITLKMLEVAKLPNSVTREAISILLENLRKPLYTTEVSKSKRLKKLLRIVSDRYHPVATALARFIRENLRDSDISDLDVPIYENDDYALLQFLTRLRQRANLSHLQKPVSLIIPFVSQYLRNQAPYGSIAPVTMSEVKEYLNSLDSPCLPAEVKNAPKLMLPILTNDLPWLYAFNGKTNAHHPWEALLNGLVKLRHVVSTQKQAQTMDNVIHQMRAWEVGGKRSGFHNYGVIFKRDDSSEVEIDLYSLIMQIPNVFRHEDFTPMLNFFSRPNILRMLDYGFNKFAYETPRSLLLGILKRASSLSRVKSDRKLTTALRQSQDYLEQPYLINVYTLEDSRTLLKQLPLIEEDARYLPLKILLRKQNLFAYLSPTFRMDNVTSPVDRLDVILSTVLMKPMTKEFTESVMFAINNLDGRPLPVKNFDRSDFVYLTNELLPRHHGEIKDEILKSPTYLSVTDWNIPVGGEPEEVLMRALNYPADKVRTDEKLSATVRRAEKLLEEGSLARVDTLKQKTLEAMFVYLPMSTYLKPLCLLLKKADLMTILPKLSVESLEKVHPRDALTTILQNLAESPLIKTEDPLLKRVRVALSIVNAKNDPEHNLLSSYLAQILSDPSDPIFEPLLGNVKSLKNIEPIEKREEWLKHYLNRTKYNAESAELKEAAELALQDLTYDDVPSLMWSKNERIIEKSLSTLLRNSYFEPLRKLLKSPWTRNVLPIEFNAADYADEEDLLRSLLDIARERTDIAENPVLTEIIKRADKILGGWRDNVQPLRRIVRAVKSAIYDPVKRFFAPEFLSKLDFEVPSDTNETSKEVVLRLLHKLMRSPTVREADRVMQMLNIVRQDVIGFGSSVDLLNVLDDAGIPNTTDFGPLRLFLHTARVGQKYGRSVFSTQNPKEQLDTLVQLLSNDSEVRGNRRQWRALEILQNHDACQSAISDISVSDLIEIANTVPVRIKTAYNDVMKLFSVHNLHRLGNRDEIVSAKNPLLLLLSEMANLPEVKENQALSRRLVAMYEEVLKSQLQGITPFQIKPLLRQIEHVQQINIDYMNELLDPKVLSYLKLPEVMDADNDVEILKFLVRHLLFEGPADVDHEMKRHLRSFERSLNMLSKSTVRLKSDLTDDDLMQMLESIPNEKEYAPVRNFMESDDMVKFIPEETDWRKFSTPQSKLIYFLTSLAEYDISSKVLYDSTVKLREHLINHFDFITDSEVKTLLRTLIDLKLDRDVSSLKLFMNHRNMIKHLPRDFRYSNYPTPEQALHAVMESLSHAPGVKKKPILYDSVMFVKDALEKEWLMNEYWRSLPTKSLSAAHFRFLDLLNVASQKLKDFLNPSNLLKILPKTFSFFGLPTFKSKVIHLLLHLLFSRTNVHSQLEELLHQVERLPDVANITKDGLQKVLDIIPHALSQYAPEIMKYLKPSTLAKLLPGTFDINKTSDAKAILHEILHLLSHTVEAAINKKLQSAIDEIVDGLTSQTAKDSLAASALDKSYVGSLIAEIPFKDYKQIEGLETELSVERILPMLPMNFKLEQRESRKQLLLRLLQRLSSTDSFRTYAQPIKFAASVVQEMPDMPRIRDTDIEKLLSIFPLDRRVTMQLLDNCNVDTLGTHLPINFDVEKLRGRKEKVSTIMRYCKMAAADDAVKETLANVIEPILTIMPDVDVTQDEINFYIQHIPCVRFPVVKPLLMYFLRNNVAKHLPWNVDVITPPTAKLTYIALLNALKDVKELQNAAMLTALNTTINNAGTLLHDDFYTELRKFFDYTTLNKESRFRSSVPGNHNDAMDYMYSEDVLAKIVPSFSWCTSCSRSPTIYSDDIHQHVVRLAAYAPRIKAEEPLKEGWRQVLDKSIKIYLTNWYPFMTSSNCTDDPLVRLVVNGLSSSEFFESAPILYINETEIWSPYHVDACRKGFTAAMHTKWAAKSKALYDAFEAAKLRNSQDRGDRFSLEYAMLEIHRDRSYDSLRLYLRCHEVNVKIQDIELTSEHTNKRVLLDFLKVIENDELDEDTKKSIVRLKTLLQPAVWDWEVDKMFKTLPHYNSRMGHELKGIRSYVVREGLDSILGHDYQRKYPTFAERLNAVQKAASTITQLNLSDDLQMSLQFLEKLKNGEIKLGNVIDRSVDDINVKALFDALPRTTNENLILGLLKFMSTPRLLHVLRLPRNPYSYRTKGRLLQIILDHGQRLPSVQEDPDQQDALLYFRDKIMMDGPGGRPIELKKYSKASTVDVDLLDLLRAVQLPPNEIRIGSKVAKFFLSEYDKLIHAVGFDQAAFSTRGAYLKAFLQHLAKNSRVPKDVRDSVEGLIPFVRLNGPGAEPIDVINDILPGSKIYSDETYEKYSEAIDNLSEPSTRVFQPASQWTADFTNLPNDFRYNVELLMASVNDVLKWFRTDSYIPQYDGSTETLVDAERPAVDNLYASTKDVKESGMEDREGLVKRSLTEDLLPVSRKIVLRSNADVDADEDAANKFRPRRQILSEPSAGLSENTYKDLHMSEKQSVQEMKSSKEDLSQISSLEMLPIVKQATNNFTMNIHALNPKNVSTVNVPLRSKLIHVADRSEIFGGRCAEDWMNKDMTSRKSMVDSKEKGEENLGIVDKT